MAYEPLVEVKPKTKELLKEWRPPKHAYILFEKREFNLDHQHNYTPQTGLMTLNVEHRPEQESKLFYYTGPMKKFRVIGYGNFPKLNEGPERRRKQAKLYSDKDGTNPWDILEDRVRYFLNLDPDADLKLKALSSENTTLKSDKETLEKRLEEVTKQLEAKTNAKNENRKSGVNASPA